MNNEICELTLTYRGFILRGSIREDLKEEICGFSYYVCTVDNESFKIYGRDISEVYFNFVNWTDEKHTSQFEVEETT